MDVPPEALQFIASLIAIFALAWFAKRLRLGGNPVLADETAARRAAQEVSDGYEPIDIAVDKDGRGALLRDARNQVMALKPHGSHFAGRILTNGASAHVQGNQLLIVSGEKRFGTVALTISQPAPWVEAINRLEKNGDA